MKQKNLILISLIICIALLSFNAHAGRMVPLQFFGWDEISLTAGVWDDLWNYFNVTKTMIYVYKSLNVSGDTYLGDSASDKTIISGELKGIKPSGTYCSNQQILKYDDTTDNWDCADESVGSSNWAVSGNDIYNSNTGNVGIGTNTPTEKLHVDGNTTIEGNFTVTGDVSINRIPFKILEDDTEDSSACQGGFGAPCSSAIDENWNSYAGMWGPGTGYVYENYTIPFNLVSATWIAKYGDSSVWENCVNDGGTTEQSCWNGTGWYDLLDFSGSTTKESLIPSVCLEDNILQIKSCLKTVDMNTASLYYEGKVTWKIGSGLLVDNSGSTRVEGNLNVSSISSDGTGKVVCIKSNGNLGTCLNNPSATGVCSCG
ncbi:MAG: hypothetical protein KAR87_00755 [Candidatus Aenigmarchaeota archaeon]|nr:hypothetical protein [Candidatus Aenigmarchaeota archaeon]